MAHWWDKRAPAPRRRSAAISPLTSAELTRLATLGIRPDGILRGGCASFCLSAARATSAKRGPSEAQARQAPRRMPQSRP